MCLTELLITKLHYNTNNCKKVLHFLSVCGHRHALTVSVQSRFHAYYGLSAYKLYPLRLMCCVAAKWDY